MICMPLSARRYVLRCGQAKEGMRIPMDYHYRLTNWYKDWWQTMLGYFSALPYPSVGKSTQ